jgi:hypothetical protein
VNDDIVKEIRQLLTDIKPLLDVDAESGSPAAVSIFSARQTLAGVRAQLEHARDNLRRWQPGPSETKGGS